MTLSRTDRRIGDFVVWSTLAVYAAAWFFGLCAMLGEEYAGLAGLTAAVYVGMHVYEMTRRNHCYLSADSTAFPVALATFGLCAAGLSLAGSRPLPDLPWPLLACVFSLAHLGGHAAALAYSAVVGLGLDCLFRKRIAAERAD